MSTVRKTAKTAGQNSIAQAAAMLIITSMKAISENLIRPHVSLKKSVLNVR